ncbi:hypothetical protein NQZ68_004355 [Dissostichus eleginoides]|nr:hypothetical protein NQZ68_004355 [Dissostichus eleginoides]
MTDARAALASLTDSRLNPPPPQHTPNDAMLFTSIHTPLPDSVNHLYAMLWEINPPPAPPPCSHDTVSFQQLLSQRT